MITGTWLVQFQHSTGSVWEYVIPVGDAPTAAQARATAVIRHTATLQRYGRNTPWRTITVTAVRFRPEILSRERATAWVALREADALYSNGGWRTSSGANGPAWEARDDGWRQRLRDFHEELRTQVLGHGPTFQDVLKELAGTPQGWDLTPYTDHEGSINWAALFGDIRKAATTTVWRTPYGVLWTDN
ncbi:hypothetical protein ACH4UT_10415 [Streptomyces sp. NPDC020799]|uniref:hypothetical protein n=1 Tax=Streptomyces sp. NPDC020799 TaxID=3365091 RepID=UPI0034895CBF